MKKQGQSSVWDNLMRIMPGLKEKIKTSPEYVDPLAAKSLYSIWRTGEKKGDRAYKKPITIGNEETERMKNSGLIKIIGDKISVTEKGAKIISIMILGDDRSAFEDNGENIEYNKALNNTKGVKTAKQIKAASSWWGRFKK
jgi:hypothetical protein